MVCPVSWQVSENFLIPPPSLPPSTPRFSYETTVAGTLLAGIILGVGAAVAWAKLSAPDEAAKTVEKQPELWIPNPLDWDAGQSDTPRHAGTGTETRNPPGPRRPVPGALASQCQAEPDGYLTVPPNVN